MTTEQNLLTLAHAFSGHTGLKLTTLGAYSVNDGKFFAERLENGRSCTLRTAERALHYFNDHWPADLAWPTDIPRPPKSKKEAA